MKGSLYFKIKAFPEVSSSMAYQFIFLPSQSVSAVLIHSSSVAISSGNIPMLVLVEVDTEGGGLVPDSQS